jgi:thiol-disulfide isomerase/thioredoxin
MRLAQIIFVPVLIGCLQYSTAVSAKEPEVKGDFLSFRLYDLEDNLVTSADSTFAGKVLFVTLWGTWCPPCVSEIPTFNDLQSRYGDDGLVIIGIAFEPDTIDAVRVVRLREFAKEKKIKYLVLDGGATTEFFDALPMMKNVKGFPVEIVIDRSGKVVDCRNGYGYKKKWARKLEKQLRGLLEIK